MSIIITGATGFVGRVLVREMVKVYSKKELVCLVRNKNNSAERNGRRILKRLGVKTMIVDLLDNKTLEGLPKDPRLIIHLAANTDTASTNHTVNSLGVKNLYKAFGRLGPKTHFVHIGTMVAVSGRTNCKSPINEKTWDSPTNEYTRTKVEGEMYLLEKCKRDNFKLTILRPNTIYGKGVRKDSLFDMVKKMVTEKSIITRINWPGRSALIHIDDLVKAILFFSKRQPLPGNAKKYLIYSENLSISQISMTMHKKLGIRYEPIKIPSLVWQIFKKVRYLVPIMEKALPPIIYNYFWRLSIIVDDVVMCKTHKTSNIIPNWRPKKLRDAIGDVS